jgi:DNA replication protein DnaC
MKHELLTRMQQLRLSGMYRAFEGIISTNNYEQLSNDDCLNILLQAEWEDRENKKIDRNLHNARFRYRASMEEIDFSHPRNLDKTQLLRLTDCSFITREENIIITGPTGVGKSYLASAIGHQACRLGYKVIYFNTQKLFNLLRMSKADESYLRETRKIEKQHLLILDDFGLQPLDAQTRMMLLEIIEDRHNLKSTIISTQLPISNWYETIGDSTVADAIMDRMLEKAVRIELKGESLRKRKKE